MEVFYNVHYGMSSPQQRALNAKMEAISVKKEEELSENLKEILIKSKL